MDESNTIDHGFGELFSGKDPTVDIIAIHGLNGHREKTWTAYNDILWLRDLLPSALPQARVLTYGYDANTHSQERVSTLTMRQHAEGLAHDITRIRKQDNRRPIIFVAYDLGGIILKAMLGMCHIESLRSDKQIRDILVSTHAVLFFGTPHSGVESNIIESINSLQSLYKKRTDVILKYLQANSSELQDVQRLYLHASENIKTIFFYEEYTSTSDGKKITLEVPYHAAMLAGDREAIVIPLHSDHQDLVRFSGRSSDNYKTVLHYLQVYLDHAPSIVCGKWVKEDNIRRIENGEYIPDKADMSFIHQLPTVGFVPSSIHDECLQGTRQVVLETIWKWASDPESDKPIFWLCDIAGSGKSTVAMSVVKRLKKEKIFGGQFFFSMSTSETSMTGKLCTTIARELAQRIPELAPRISEAVTRNPDIPTSPFDEQFRTLIIGPLQHQRKHVIIVIDAVDECKSEREKKQLLKTLTETVKESTYLRVFITSRPDRVIEKALEALSVKDQLMDLTDRFHSSQYRYNTSDIATYVHHELDEVLPDKNNRHKLIERANGLFIWAKTVCQMLQRSIDPEGTYNDLISIDKPGVIDNVYDLIFKRIDQTSIDVIHQMLAILLRVFEPLTIIDLDDLLKHAKVRGSAKKLVEILGSTLKKDPTTNLIQFRHPTFIEYLGRRLVTLSLGSPKELNVDVANVHGQVASWCLKCLLLPRDGLRFNICQLESSFYRNRELPDIEARISRFISSSLRYSSVHWLFHMAQTDCSWRHQLRNKLQEIIRIPHVLYWMEILSLVGGVARAISGLRAVIQNTGVDESRYRISEIRRFMMTFSVPIQDSVPHIYISALPFMPTKSYMSIEGLNMYANTLKVTQGLEETYHGLRDTLRGHTDDIQAFAVSLDGSWIASGSKDGTVRLWDAETGQLLGEPLRGHTDSVRTVAFSPNGSRIVSGSDDYTIRLWDAETGKLLGKPLRGHTTSVIAIAFSPDGSQLTSASQDRTIRLWDMETRQLLREPLRGHPNWVRAIAFSLDGSRFAFGLRNNTIQLYNTETGQSLGEPLQGHTDTVNAVAFSPDGSRIVSGSDDYTVRLWNAETGESLGEPLQGHTNSVIAIAFSPDSSQILSCSRDGTIRLWDTETGQSLEKPFREDACSVYAISFSPDGSWVAFGLQNNTIHLWNMETEQSSGEPFQGHEGPVVATAFSPDGSRIVSASFDSTIRLWNAETGESLGEPLHVGHQYVIATTFSPDSSQILSGSRDGTIRLWDMETGQSLGGPFREYISSIAAISFSPDGSRVAFGLQNDTIELWDMETGQLLGEPLQGHTDTVKAVAFSPDGSRIVSGSDDYTARLWNVETGESLGEPLQGHTNSVIAIAFSPGGSQIVSGSRDGTIRLWDAETGQLLGEPLQGHNDSVNVVGFLPDGMRIISGSDDRTIRLWDANTGQSLGDVLQGHLWPVGAIIFSPDGLRIVSGSHDTVVRSWDAVTGHPLGEPLQMNKELVRCIAFSPDGSRVAFGLQDDTIPLWDTETGQSLGDPLRGHTSYINDISFSSDGLQIVSGSHDTTVRLWDVTTGHPLGRPFQGHTRRVWVVALSPDGSRIASGSRDETIRLWNPETGQSLGKPLWGHKGSIVAITFSPDGSRIASGGNDETIRLWDVDTGQLLGKPFQGHTDSVTAVAFSPDGSRIVSGSHDDTIRLWDVETGQAQGEPLRGHTASVQTVIFSPDGSRIVSGSADNKILLWNAEATQFLAEPLQEQDNLDLVNPTASVPDALRLSCGTMNCAIGMETATLVETEDHHGHLEHSIREGLISSPALMTFPGHMLSQSQKILLSDDGWVRLSGKLLFWVPPDNRASLTSPLLLTMPTSSPPRPTKIDFARFQCGVSWTKVLDILN